MHSIPELDAAGLRRFAFATGAIFAGLFGLFFPWLLSVGFPTWPWILAAGLGLWGLIAPASLRPVYIGWMKLGLLLNRITTPIILGILFFLVLMPIGIVMRTFGKDPMQREISDDIDSYRVESKKARSTGVERPF